MACNSLFKEPDLLAYLNISRATLNRWIAEEHFPKGIKLGSGTRGAVRWRHEDVDSWVESREKEMKGGVK